MAAAAETDAAAAVQRRLYTASALCASFLLVEVMGGYLAGSLAVLSDAAHFAGRSGGLFGGHCGLALGGVAAVGAAHVRIEADGIAGGPVVGPVAGDRVGGAGGGSAAATVLYSGVCGGGGWRTIILVVVVVNGTIMSGTAAIGVAVNVVLALILGEHHVHLPGAAAHDHDHSHDHHAHGHEHHHHCAGDEHHGDEDAAAAAVQETTPLLMRSIGGGEHHHSDEVDPQLSTGRAAARSSA